MGLNVRPQRDVVIRVPKVIQKLDATVTTARGSGNTAAKGKERTIDFDTASLEGMERVAEETQGGEEEERLPVGDRSPFKADLSSLPSDPRQASAIKSYASAAEWNSLLIWARANRGPQWDAATGLWHVDKGSQAYYSFCSNPRQSEEAAQVQSGAADDDEDDDAGPRRRATQRVQDRDSSPILGPGNSVRSARGRRG
ncbi:hypothetical protein K437DRAFT_268287 [Tilletiaria anomala UBC 951]|uniref:Uncharacterized protein n=1 Tax=Tilletiaria anomala (strain ATCC 24038 / CBS 436.72 / UBC 951) TaxID=1037660 RepID=A0A066W558_TILAU|nr:uncharacterized protein K437DRAFT_268287 [Tilletiaria anomala UBC 951]KDN45885.1 hypothetical protein K437DRAFT_268287 [Tilletiaria anomala UBC 951]